MCIKYINLVYEEKAQKLKEHTKEDKVNKMES